MSALETLNALGAQAAALGRGEVVPQPLHADEAEVARVMQICNACRYCEGFCAVFPAMTRRLSFAQADVHLLANLCHNCGACLHACQYAPPHEFALNVPQAMAKVRVRTYSDLAWPAALGSLYRRNGLTVALALAFGLALFLALAVALKGKLWQAIGPEGFYAIFPHNLLVGLFAPVFGFVVLALGQGVRRFWTGQPSAPVAADAAQEAARDVLTLRYLGGGHGDGCNNEDDAFSLARRRFHHATFYGFLLCFAATSVATLYHYLLDRPAPYGYDTLPKWLGIAGGVLMVVGTSGLFVLNRRRHPLQGDAAQKPMDLGFIGLLFGTAATGLGLMLLRGSAAMPLALCVHLGFVMALFLTMPYGKFAHGIYRSAALLKWAVEKRQPSNLALGDD
ncbi:tricarballylate utilization 4Fe-4S protein TcuB [Hydrogenophaga sp. RWCD_12]|uniref:tricarballylate utilization 4Fe-4S protein TcuB n=1 Tax=Hydrogenophaga sp. RWCD_12 TaxID=3391190 RepID=UPI0039854019